MPTSHSRSSPRGLQPDPRAQQVLDGGQTVSQATLLVKPSPIFAALEIFKRLLGLLLNKTIASQELRADLKPNERNNQSTNVGNNQCK